MRRVRMSERFVLEPLLSEWLDAAEAFRAVLPPDDQLPSLEAHAAANRCLEIQAKWIVGHISLRGGSRRSAHKAFTRMAGKLSLASKSEQRQLIAPLVFVDMHRGRT